MKAALTPQRKVFLMIGRYLFGKILHGRVSKLFWQLGSSMFLARSVDVEDAEVGKDLLHDGIIEEGLQFGFNM